MSHFCLLVVGDNVEEQLTPFNDVGQEDITNIKFDYYEIGGIWKDMFKLKSQDCFVNSAKKCQIDWEFDYITCGDFCTFAILNEGKWLSSKRSIEEDNNWKVNFYDRFIKDLPDDSKLTIVDCHG